MVNDDIGSLLKILYQIEVSDDESSKLHKDLSKILRRLGFINEGVES